MKNLQALKNNKPELNISSIASLKFCEQSFYLQTVMGLKLTSKEMVNGLQKHEELLQKHLEKAELELTIEQALQKAIVEKQVLSVRELPLKAVFNNYLLKGRIDEVLITPEKVFIIDDKPKSKVFDSHKAQLYGYALLFKKALNPAQHIFIALRDWNSQTIYWEQAFKQEHALIVENLVMRALQILNGSKPMPTSNANHCKNCVFKTICKHSKANAF